MNQRGLLPLVIFVCICVNAAHGFTGELENPYSAKDFVTKLPSKGEVGPAGMAFVGDYLYVLDHSSSCLYRFSAAHGGSADGNSRNALNCYDKTPGGVGYTGISTDASAQRLFISQQQPGSVFEVDPENGQIIDTIASDVPGVSSLAADQVYGDLYAVQSSGAEEDTVFRFRFRSIPNNAKALKKQAKIKAKATFVTAKSSNTTSSATAVKSTTKKTLKKSSKKLKRKAKKNGKKKTKKATRRSKRSILRRKRTQAKRQRKRRAAMRRKARARAYADSNQSAAEADASRWKNKVVVKRIYSRVKLQAGKKVLTSAPDGTLYVASSDAIISIPMSRRKLAPNYRIISGLGDVAGITVSADKRRLLVNHHSGKITEVNLTNMTTKAILRKGTRGDCIAFGPDGCIYASQTDEILRISTQPDGSCAGDFGPNPEAYRRSMVHWINEQGVKMQTEQSNKNRRRKQLAREEMRKNNEMDRKQLEIQRRKDRFNDKQTLLDEQQVKLDRKEEKLQERADEEEFKLDMKVKEKADALKNQLRQMKQKKPKKQVKLTPPPKPAAKNNTQSEEERRKTIEKQKEQQVKSAETEARAKTRERDQKQRMEDRQKVEQEQKAKADAIAKKNLAEEKRRLMICSTNPCKRDTDVCSTSPVAPYYNCTHACASFDLKQCLDTHRCRARHHAGSCVHACTGYDGCEHHSWTGLCVGEEHKPKCANPCTAGGDRSGEIVCKEFGLACVADRHALVKYRCVKCPRHMAGKECNRLKQIMVANLATGANGPSVTRLISSASAPGAVTGTKLAVPGLSVPAISLDSFKSNGDIVFTTGALNMVYKASRDGDGYSTPTPFARLGVDGFAHGIAVGPDNTVYVTSRSTDRIFRLSEKGAILSSISTHGVCSRPAGIILSPKKTRLFVACSAAETLDPKPRVVMYTLNLKRSKKFMTHKLLTSPGGFAFDSDKNLYISNLLPVNGNSTLIRVAAPSHTMIAGVPSPGKHVKNTNSNSTKGRKVTVFAKTNEGVASDVGVDANDNVYWTVKSSSPSVENFVLQFPPNYKKKVGGKPQSGTKISLGNVFVPSGVKLV